MLEHPIEGNSVTMQMLLAAKQAMGGDGEEQGRLMEIVVGDLLENNVLVSGDDAIIGAVTDFFAQQHPSQDTKMALSKLDADAKRPVEESWGSQPTTSTIQSLEKEEHEEHARTIRSCIISSLCNFLRPSATGFATAGTLVRKLEVLINTATNNDVGEEAKKSALNTLQKTITEAFKEKSRSKVAATKQKPVPPPKPLKPKPDNNKPGDEESGQRFSP